MAASSQTFPAGSPPFLARAPQLLPPIAVAAKLPSLEGLLKQMQVGLSPAREPVPQHLSPVSRPPAPMPPLRSMISPSMSKSVFHSAGSPASSLGYSPPPAYSAMPVSATYAPRKRTWSGASPAQALYAAAHPRASSPASSTSSGSGAHPHRSRASKYCKVEGCQRVSQRNNLCHSHGGKRLCKEDGCSSKDRGNGYCIKHGGGKICSMGGCEKKARRKGLCTQHFRVAEEGSVAAFAYDRPPTSDDGVYRSY